MKNKTKILTFHQCLAERNFGKMLLKKILVPVKFIGQISCPASIDTTSLFIYDVFVICQMIRDKRGVGLGGKAQSWKNNYKTITVWAKKLKIKYQYIEIMQKI